MQIDSIAGSNPSKNEEIRATQPKGKPMQTPDDDADDNAHPPAGLDFTILKDVFSMNRPKMSIILKTVWSNGLIQV